MQLLKDLLESAGIQGDLPEKIETLFTAALKEAVDAEVLAQTKRLDESFDSRMNEAKDAFVMDEGKKLEAFLDHVITEWAKTNAMAIDGAGKIALAEKFLKGLGDLVGVGGEKIKTLDESAQVTGLQAESAALAAQVKDLTEQVAMLKAEKALTERADIVAELTEGLTDVQADRVASLAEAFAATAPEVFRAKVTALVEAVADKEDKGNKKEGEDGKGNKGEGEGDKGTKKEDPKGENKPDGVETEVNESTQGTQTPSAMDAYIKAITG